MVFASPERISLGNLNKQEKRMQEKHRLVIVAIYASAMAWVEAAVVIYLRTLIGRLQPYQPNPLALSAGTGLAGVEAVREAATLIMLLAVGWLAGRTWRSRLAYAMIAFGLWDILYYAFLAVIGPWPSSLMDWDILFLLPLPWWGPVLAPLAIAVVLIVSGILVSQFDQPDHPLWPRRWAQVTGLVGAGIALFVFMADAIHALTMGSGVGLLGKLLPVQFNWLLFSIALILMSMPAVDLGRHIHKR
jgi:hypothetical protein